MRRLAGATAAVLLAGCVEDLKEIKLQPDGSGTLTQTRRMKRWAVDLARKNKVPDEFTAEKARERAAAFGEGVRYVSCEKLEAEEWIGRKAVYAFDDVSKLRLDGEEGPATSFRLDKREDGTRLLRVSMPFKPAASRASGEDALRLTEEQERELLAGLKMRVTVEAAGKVKACSSPFLEGTTLTLLEVDFDKLLAEEARLKKRAAAEPATLEEAKEINEALKLLLALQGGSGNVEELRGALRKIQGFKHACVPEVTLEFSP